MDSLCENTINWSYSKISNGEFWHSDVSCDEIPPLGTMLQLHKVPSVGGDTLFLDQSGENIEFCSQYKTDRLIIFDSSIPHIIRPSTNLSPYYRLSLAMKFK